MEKEIRERDYRYRERDDCFHHVSAESERACGKKVACVSLVGPT